MIDFESPDDDPLAPAPAPRRKPLRRILLALAALGVVGGVGAWLSGGSGVSDDSVLLLQADTTPYKMKPEDPGGYEMPHQDRLVFGRLHPDRQAKPEIERLLPPPEDPLPRPVPPPPPQAAVQPPAPAAAPQPEAPAPETTAPATTPAPAVVVQMPLQSPPPPSPQPSAQRPPPPPLPEGSPQPAASPLPQVTAVPGTATPNPAPATENPVPAPVQAAAIAPPPPPPPPAGGTRLQLGSVSSEEAAKSEWARLTRRFPGALGDLRLSVSRAQVGERTVYRLVAGPVGEIRALAICDELKAANAPCIIVRP
ncbi:MAG TPA: SPOR domain-containing protein [Azospirillaceae bacterium]|nr:SPOR domain-containing protein [Azospirillaceae bacterium]